MTDTFRYSRTMIALHWISAGLIAASWLTAQVIDVFPRAHRGPITSIHMFLGVATGAAILARLALRAAGTPRPAPDEGIADWVARAVHMILYALVIAAALLGIANAWARGASVFGVFTFTSFTTDRDLRHLIGGLHETATDAIVILAAGHAMIALAHYVLLGDSVLRRMLPRA